MNILEGQLIQTLLLLEDQRENRDVLQLNWSKEEDTPETA